MFGKKKKFPSRVLCAFMLLNCLHVRMKKTPNFTWESLHPSFISTRDLKVMMFSCLGRKTRPDEVEYMNQARLCLPGAGGKGGCLSSLFFLPYYRDA